ncbi:MAG TPA: porin family protein [Ginsengibacter sp.]|nr:porin family protein [Ginsengibacter sp.]
MKQTITIALMFFCISANAQIHIGAKGGISIPDLKGNSVQSKGYTSREDAYLGLIANFQLSRFFSLQPEINYSPQGGQRNGMQPIPADAMSGIMLPPGVNVYANFRNSTILNYLEVPLLLKLTLGHNLKYYLCFGPHIAFLTEAKTKTSGSSLLYLDAAGTMPLTQNGSELPPVSFNSTTNIKESIKKVNMGVQGGWGLEYPVGMGSIFIEGRAIIGLTNIQTHPENDGKNQTGSLVIALGYLIKIK